MSRITPTRLTAVALAAGALLGAAALPASAADHDRDHNRDRYRDQVTISDVQYDSPGPDDRSNRSLNAEWVDVTNDGRHAVDLTDWTLSDEDGHEYTFDLRLGAGRTVRVHTGTGRDTNRDVYQNRRAYVWNNDEDTATLRNDHDRIIDTDSWGHHHHGGHGHGRDDRR